VSESNVSGVQGGWPDRVRRKRRRRLRFDRRLIPVALFAGVVGTVVGAGIRYAESVGADADQLARLFGSLLAIGLVLGMLVALLRYFFRSADALVFLLVAATAAVMAYPVGPVTSQPIEVAGTSTVTGWHVVETHCRWGAGRWRLEAVWGLESAGGSYRLEILHPSLDLTRNGRHIVRSTLDRVADPPLIFGSIVDGTGFVDFSLGDLPEPARGRLAWACPPATA
jgi:hypothetical protein